MHRMGFCHTWIHCIKCCVESASMSILVNGSPTDEFIGERGVCQGNPLAPFLFIMVAEGLGELMRVVVRQDLFEESP